MLDLLIVVQPMTVQRGAGGDGTSGRLGDGGAMDNRLTRVAVDGLDSGVTAISVSGTHSCAIQDGGVKCWGDHTHMDQLGRGVNPPDPNDNTLIAKDVSLLNHSVTAIAAGAWSHTCAIQDSAAWCWGEGEGNRLGSENNDQSDAFTPRRVAGLNDGVTAIAAGDRHGCAIHNGVAKCWGANDLGQLGDGTEMPQQTPVPVKDPDGLDITATAITAGGFHSCAIVDAAAQCWGSNSSGQLGDGTQVQRSVAVAVEGLDDGVTAITAGWIHTCAIVNAAAKCWGFNGNGQLGDDSRVSSLVAVSVVGLDDGVTAIAVGGSFLKADNTQDSGHSCAIHYGFIKCWGENSRGQLGNGKQIDTDEPVQVRDLNPFAAPSQLTADAITTEGIEISWTAPIPAEDIPITGYIVSWGVDLTDQNTLRTADVPASMTSYVITGLTAGTLYQVAVSAVNVGGEGAQSIISTVLPVRVPVAPIITEVVPSPRALKVVWNIPTDNGGEAITAFTVYWNESLGSEDRRSTTVNYDALTGAVTASFTITGLTDVTAYQITVSASNVSAGEGAESAMVIGVTPAVPPTAPTRVTIMPQNGALLVEWGVPTDDGGGAITAFTVYWDASGNAEPPTPSSGQIESASTSVTLGGLENGKGYLIEVSATNSEGEGALSAAQLGTPRTVPNQVILTNAEVVGRTINMEWEVPGDGGAAITEFRIDVSNASSTGRPNGDYSTIAYETVVVCTRVNLQQVLL